MGGWVGVVGDGSGQRDSCYLLIFSFISAIELEGIFRVSGSRVKIDELKARYDEGIFRKLFCLFFIILLSIIIILFL